MYKVFFSREERSDPLMLAKQAIDEAIFKREAVGLGLRVFETPEFCEMEFVVDIKEELVLRQFLNAIATLDLPRLNVFVPAGELDKWEADDLDDDFTFESGD